MAHFIAAADGNLTDAATWGTVDATSLLYSVTAQTTLTTSYVESSSFTPGAITIDGIAVYLTNRVASPTGTISCRLAQAGATVAGTEVTINVSDVPRVQTTTGTFNSQQVIFFKFAAPVLLVAATLYTVSLKTSSASQIDAHRDGTAGNWSRMLRTTTTGAPGAGDNMFVLGEWTAAATKTNRTVTQNNTAATDFGAASTNQSLPALGIGVGGTLTWGTTASTNYLLRLSGTLRVWPHGHMNMGTTGTPVPASSTATLQLDCAADNDFRFIVDGGGGFGFTGKGSPRTAGKNVIMCLLNGDEAAGQTILSVDTDTGWVNGDIIRIVSTTQTATQTEERTVSSSNATTVTITAGLGSAHSGTSPTQAEVYLLTRNVLITSTTDGLQTGVVFMADATIDIDWVQFRQCGVASVVNAIDVRTGPSGSLTSNYCSLTDFDAAGFTCDASPDWSNVNVSNFMACTNSSGAVPNTAFYLDNTTGTNNAFTNLFVAGVTGGSGNRDGLTIRGGGFPVTGARVSGCQGDGIVIEGGAVRYGVLSDFHAHSNGGTGFDINNAFYGVKINGAYGWRNTLRGLALGTIGYCEIDTGRFHGNVTRNISVNGSLGELILKNVTVSGDTSFSVGEGIQFTVAQPVPYVRFENCQFGVVSGIFTAHTVEDIDLSSCLWINMELINTTLGSATELTATSSLGGRSKIVRHRQDGTTNVHITTNYGLIPATTSYETVTFRTATPSEKLAPNGTISSIRAQSSVFQVRANSGSTVNVAVYVAKDASYSGSAPRLVLKSNAALGVDSDTVLATHSSPINVFEQLAGTTPAPEEDGVFEFVVEIDGTGGAVYVDDWSGS